MLWASFPTNKKTSSFRGLCCFFFFKMRCYISVLLETLKSVRDTLTSQSLSLSSALPTCLLFVLSGGHTRCCLYLPKETKHICSRFQQKKLVTLCCKVKVDSPTALGFLLLI